MLAKNGRQPAGGGRGEQCFGKLVNVVERKRDGEVKRGREREYHSEVR